MRRSTLTRGSTWKKKKHHERLWHYPGIKVSSCDDNPFDNFLVSSSRDVLELLHRTGHTPNVVTTYGVLFKALGLVALYRRWPITFVVCRGQPSHGGVAAPRFLFAYYCDCLDGALARVYEQTTWYGDLYDHATDSLFVAGLLAIVWIRYREATQVEHFCAFVTLWVISSLHMGCVQKKHNANKTESLDFLKCGCEHPADIRILRYFSCGTFVLVMMGVLLDVMHRA